MAAGGLAVTGFSPSRALAAGAAEAACPGGDGPIGLDPRALRGGNLPSVFNVGHWLRDRRLTFEAQAVRVAPACYDSVAGRFPIHEDGTSYDVLVVGAGISGLAAAHYVQRERPGARVLLLEANPFVGGVASRDDLAPIPTPASTGGAYCVAPFAEFLEEFYAALGIDWTAHVVEPPFYSYFFDQHTPFVPPGTKGWTLDTFGAGLGDVPYPAAVRHDLKRARQDFIRWYNRAGSPTDPPDNSDPRFDSLAHKTLHEYLTVDRGFHEAVSDFYTRYSVDALGGNSRQVNAHTAISFLGSEHHPIFSFPGGTSGIARHALKRLLPTAIPGATTAEILANPIDAGALDRPGSAVRLRLAALALRADTCATHASLTYFHSGRFRRVRAQAVVLAGLSHTAQHLVAHLASSAARAAWRTFTLVPTAMANVTLRRAAPLVDLGLGYNQYYWGSRFWADFVVADWVGPQRLERERPTVLTFYGGGDGVPEEQPAERVRLLNTTFGEYEQSLREDLERVLAPAGFDFARDVSAVYVYRWGHGMVLPKPGSIFGPPQGSGGQTQRTPAPRHVARASLGRVSFAGQDVEGSPAMESAIGSGLRTAQEALVRL